MSGNKVAQACCATGLLALAVLQLQTVEHTPSRPSVVAVQPDPPQIELELPGHHAAIEFWQDGRRVELDDDTLHLQPAEFSVRIVGDSQRVAYHLHPDGSVADALADLDAPLVTTGGTWVAQYPGQMGLHGSVDGISGVTAEVRDAKVLDALKQRLAATPRLFGLRAAPFAGLLGEGQTTRDMTDATFVITAVETAFGVGGPIDGCMGLTLLLRGADAGTELGYAQLATHSVELCFDGEATAPMFA